MRCKKGVLNWGIGLFSVSMLMTSCASGFDSDEKFSSGVYNSELEAPALDASSFSTLVNSDGSESIKVTWSVVYGANGYSFSVQNVDDPSNPTAIITDSIIDGCSATFAKAEDTKYKITLRSCGGRDGNSESETPSQYVYSTYTPATTVPTGSDLAEFVNNNLVAGTDQAFELEAGQTYYLNSVIDFNICKATLRGDKINRPTIIVGEAGGLMTQAGLTVKNINFDCTAMAGESSEVGLIGLGKEPSASLSTEALGYKAKGANQDGYVIQDAITFKDCNVKNLPNSLLYGNKQSWSLLYFTVSNCIIQLNNSGSNSVINLYGASNGLIKNLVVKNNTFYNLAENSSAYFLRYSGSSNAQPKKIFGTGETATLTYEYNTFCRTMTGKDFANNLANTDAVTTVMNYNILYDVYRVYQFVQTNTKRITLGNIVCNVASSESDNDTSRTDSNGNPLCTREDPAFVGPYLQELDLTQSNGGVNFTPTGSATISNKAGDPRWY